MYRIHFFYLCCSFLKSCLAFFKLFLKNPLNNLDITFLLRPTCMCSLNFAILQTIFITMSLGSVWRNFDNLTSYLTPLFHSALHSLAISDPCFDHVLFSRAPLCWANTLRRSVEGILGDTWDHLAVQGSFNRRTRGGFETT